LIDNIQAIHHYLYDVMRGFEGIRHWMGNHRIFVPNLA